MLRAHGNAKRVSLQDVEDLPFMTADELSGGVDGGVPDEAGGGLGALSSSRGCCADSFLRQSSHPFVALFHLLFKVRAGRAVSMLLCVGA